MASSSTRSWPIGATVRFESLEFLVAIEGLLVRIESPALTPLASCVATEEPPVREGTLAWVAAGESTQLWRCLERFLGPAPTQEDLCHTLFTLVNIQG